MIVCEMYTWLIKILFEVDDTEDNSDHLGRKQVLQATGCSITRGKKQDKLQLGWKQGYRIQEVQKSLLTAKSTRVNYPNNGLDKPCKPQGVEKTLPIIRLIISKTNWLHLNKPNQRFNVDLPPPGWAWLWRGAAPWAGPGRSSRWGRGTG